MSSVSLSPDGSALAIGYGNLVEIWDTKTGRRLPADLGDFVTAINAVQFSRDGRTVYTGSGDGPLTAWDAATGVLRFRKTHGPLPSISCLDVSADGRWIATCGMKEGLADGNYVYAATLWDARTGEPVRDYYDHERPLYTQRVAISPDSRLLALAGKRLGNEVVTQIWDVKTGKKLAEIHPEQWEMHPLCMRFSPESRSLMTFNQTAYLRRWNAMTGALEKEFFAAKTPADRHRNHSITGAAIAPDFETAVSSDKHSLQTWNAHTGKLASDIQLAPTRPPRLFRDLAISDDGRLLAAVETLSTWRADGNDVIRIYERAGGRELQKINAGTLFGGLDFSPDGSRLAGVMRDGTALIWDLSPAQRLRQK